MFRSEALDGNLWEVDLTKVIREDHLERAVAGHEKDVERGPDPKARPRPEARLKYLVRAEEIILERFGRGLITESVLDKELVRLSKERAAVNESLDARMAACASQPGSAQTLRTQRTAVEDLREKLARATAQDRRDAVRAIVAKDGAAVRLSPARLEARLLLAAAANQAVARRCPAGAKVGP